MVQCSLPNSVHLDRIEAQAKMLAHLICCINHSDVIPFVVRIFRVLASMPVFGTKSWGHLGTVPCWWDGLYSPTPFSPDGRHSGRSRPVFRGDERCWLDNGLRHSLSVPSTCPLDRTPSYLSYEIPVL